VIIDLHLHTHHSDGVLPPRELLAAVRLAQVDRFAVTDHDSLAGWRELAGEAGIVPGVEVTAERGGREIHIVGLGFDPLDAGLNTFLAEIRALRVRRITILLARLPESVRRGLTLEALREDPVVRHSESLGRLHLAKALVRRGGVASISDAFLMHLGDDHTCDAELESYPAPAVVADRLRAAGGVAILAHPGIYGSFAAIEPLMAEGLDGLEVNHPNLDPGLHAELLGAAAARGWLASAGSDMHFLGTRKPGAWSMDGLHRPLLERIRAA
jgi:predicted metal-dependent phosphoesterase TrpH